MAALAVLFLTAFPGTAFPGYLIAPGDLTLLSIEDLMAIEFTTLSRKTRRLSDTAAAVFVISEEDIRRSGALNIPDALRMVPGLQVARIAADKWAVSSRGFNGWFSNKLLVLMDGRTVYNTIFSGVYWHAQDVLMEDVARIEVIRGPGASLWGANAVNGIINIVTKTASEAHGGLFVVGAGTEERVFGAVRYGGRLGESAHYSAYIKHAEHDGVVDVTGADVDDAWCLSKSAGRMDWELTGRDRLTFMVDFHEGRINSIYYSTGSPTYLVKSESSDRLEGYNFLGRWQHTFSATSDMVLQTYYSRSETSLSAYSEKVDTFDVDLQHRFALGQRQEIMWGLGYRLNHGHIVNTPILAFDPEERTDRLFSFFIQDEISIMPRQLVLIIGSKFEENDYTGWEVQPNVRLLWMPRNRHSYWASVSRAVRTPSRFEHDLHLKSALAKYPGAFIEVLGNEDFESEVVIAYEAGYRFFSHQGFGLDLAVFYNRYDHLRTWEAGTPYVEGWPPQYVFPFIAVNEMHGDAYGAEMAVDWSLSAGWRLKGSYSYLIMDLKDDVMGDAMAKATVGSSPVHQLSVQAIVDLPFGIQWDVWLRYIDQLPADFQSIPSYWSLDMRLAWRVNKSLEVSLVGQNMCDPHHPEFVSEIEGIIPARIERSVYAKLLWRF